MSPPLTWSECVCLCVSGRVCNSVCERVCVWLLCWSVFISVELVVVHQSLFFSAPSWRWRYFHPSASLLTVGTPNLENLIFSCDKLDRRPFNLFCPFFCHCWDSFVLLSHACPHQTSGHLRPLQQAPGCCFRGWRWGQRPLLGSPRQWAAEMSPQLVTG